MVNRILNREWIEPRIRDLGFQEFHWLEEVDSTNDYAKRWMAASDGQALQMLIATGNQTAGRGRGTNTWWSPEGCLTFSILWKPDRLGMEFSQVMERLPQVALITGIAMAKSIDLWTSIPSRIKWPNDLYIAGKKVGGILVESAGNAWVIGVGLNVFSPIDQAPEEVQERATSMHYWSNREPSMSDLLTQCCELWLSEMENWLSDSNYLYRAWPERCFLSGELCEFQTAQQSIQGRCQGIDPWGRLLLVDASAKQHALSTGTVRIVS